VPEMSSTLDLTLIAKIRAGLNTLFCICKQAFDRTNHINSDNRVLEEAKYCSNFANRVLQSS